MDGRIRNWNGNRFGVIMRALRTSDAVFLSFRFSILFAQRLSVTRNQESFVIHILHGSTVFRVTRLNSFRSRKFEG